MNMVASAPPPPASRPKPPGKPVLPKPGVIARTPTVRVPKNFSVSSWSGANEGEKVVLYGGSGMGKTTLASMLEDATFIGVDDGGRKIRNPKTGEPVRAVMGVQSFEDVRDALASKSLWTNTKSLVIDTHTRLEALGEAWTIENVKTDKGETVKGMEGYGWGKGYRHLLETMRLILSDLDQHVRAGRNICLLCQESQATVANAEGADFVQDGPKLCHTKQASVRLETTEWADHVFRIGYLETKIAAPVIQGRVGTGKIVSADTTRVVYTMPQRHFVAKSRTMTDAVISFNEPSDDSVWQLLFAK